MYRHSKKKKIDYNKGIKQETMSTEEFNKRHPTIPELTGVNQVTIYSVDDVGVKDYCPKHSGVTIVDGEVLEYTEECDESCQV